MGRRKLKMELLTTEKHRKMAFKTKKADLIKKLHELTVLCDVKACMIIYDGTKQEPQIWPQNLDEVRGLIDKYRTKEKDQSGHNKMYCLSDFFKDKKKKVKHDLDNLQKENLEAKYPSWFESLDNLTELELKVFAGNLGDKEALVKSRIEQLKRNKADVERLICQGQVMDFMNFGGPRIDWSLVNHHQGIPSLMHNEMLMNYGYNPFACVDNGVSYGSQNSMMHMGMDGNGDEFAKGCFNPVDFENPVGGWFSGPPMVPPMPMPLATYMQPPGQLQFPSMTNIMGQVDFRF